MTAALKTIPLSAVIFDEGIYPRRDHDPALVRRYAADLEQIEAAGRHISVTPDMRLLDGKHRWLAYRSLNDGNDRQIQALVYPVDDPADQLLLACKLNSAHGWQLAEEDKRDTARDLYSRGRTYEEIAAALSVGKAKVVSWLADLAQLKRDERDRKIIDLWFACHTQEEIANAVGCPRGTVDTVLRDFAEKVPQNQNSKLAAAHADGFQRQWFDWWFSDKEGSFLTEREWIDQLLCFHSDPLRVVVAPFTRSSALIDVCRWRYRRYWVSDAQPPVEHEHHIRRHDLAAGLPPVPRWRDVSLVYLDPPGGCDEKIVNAFARKLPPGAYIAAVFHPLRSDPAADLLLRGVKIRFIGRYCMHADPLMYSEDDVAAAIRERRMLDITRRIVVWRMPGKRGDYNPATGNSGITEELSDA